MRLALVVVSLLVRLVFIVRVRKDPHVAERGGQNIRAMAIHFHLANAVPFALPTAMRRERAFFRSGDSAERRHCLDDFHFSFQVSAFQRFSFCLIKVMVMAGKQPPEPTSLFPAAMRGELVQCPEIQAIQQAEPNPVKFANHNFVFLINFEKNHPRA